MDIQTLLLVPILDAIRRSCNHGSALSFDYLAVDGEFRFLGDERISVHLYDVGRVMVINLTDGHRLTRGFAINVDLSVFAIVLGCHNHRGGSTIGDSTLESIFLAIAC